MAGGAPTPLYLDWGFWAAIVAAAAVILSQFPPIRDWFRGPKLLLYTYDRINLTHSLGNPNVNFFLILHNEGRRAVRVTSIQLGFIRERTAFSLPAKSFFPDLGDKAALFAPFSLAPGQDWAHSVFFADTLSREDERTARQLTAALKADIAAKKQLPGNAERIVDADEANVRPVIEFFTRHFVWVSGEYTVRVVIITDPAKWTVTKDLRLTIFETETDELRSYTAQYKTGLGVYYMSHIDQPGINPAVTPQ